MKICHITSVHPRYDVRIFYKECRALAKEGYQVSLIVADGMADEVNSGVSILNVGRFSNRFRRMIAAPQAIFNKVMELKPDLVHFHDPELIRVGRKLSRHNIKVIYDVHEDVPGKILVKHWIPAFARPLIAKLTQVYEEKSAKSFAGIVSAADVLSQRFLKSNQLSITLANYPSLADLAASYTAWEERQDRVCYVGSISEVRGIFPLVDSLAISQVTLDLIGPFSPPGLAEAIKLREGYSYVNCKGVLRGKDLGNYLRIPKVGIATILPIQAHLDAKNFSTKIFEYLLVGIPIVISNFPLWEEFIQKYSCGIAVDPNDPKAIATACRYLLDNQEVAKQMGLNGRAAVLENFTWEAEQAKLFQLYRQILKN